MSVVEIAPPSGHEGEQIRRGVAQPRLNILGIRGIPAQHGGFESFAAHFAPYMRDAGWAVTVYCQGKESQKRPTRSEDLWEGIHRVHFDTRSSGALATIEFDTKSVIDAARKPGIDLVLGYNTAFLVLYQRLRGRKVVTNMDGIEWKRQKWNRFAKVWFWLNELIGGRFSTATIADHPGIAEHLSSRGCQATSVIPYGSFAIRTADPAPLAQYGLVPDRYLISICRIEPENSIIELVSAFRQARTGLKMIVIGRLDPNNAYHRRVAKEGRDCVIFPGPIYDQDVVASLRFHSRAYLHGHQVGGTNPSLVEALGARSLVIAHDNRFNRWTAGDTQFYFSSVLECTRRMEQCAALTSVQLSEYRQRSAERHERHFTLAAIHLQYEALMAQVHGSSER